MSDFGTTSLVRARKPHRCRDCGVEIPPGARYYRHRGLYDGAFYSDATCVDCQHLGADLFEAGIFSEGAYGEECFPYLPEVEWSEVRAMSADWNARVDALFARWQIGARP